MVVKLLSLHDVCSMETDVRMHFGKPEKDLEISVMTNTGIIGEYLQ